MGNSDSKAEYKYKKVPMVDLNQVPSDEHKNIRLTTIDGYILEGEIIHWLLSLSTPDHVLKYDFKNLLNRINGHGKITYANGDVHEGKFSYGKLAEGSIKYSNGDIHEGRFVCGALAQGSIKFANGHIREGAFLNGKLNGKGKFIRPSTGVFEGEFKNNKLNGQGSITYLTGDIYKGSFGNNQLHGNGIIKYKIGATLKGPFYLNVLNNFGTLTIYNKKYCSLFIADGCDKYVGSFINNKPDGFGRVYYNNKLVSNVYFSHGKMTYLPADECKINPDHLKNS